MANNNSLLFYREYFNADADGIKLINKQINKSTVVEIKQIIEGNKNILNLKTIYPGLLIGSGYGHDFKGDVENDKKEQENEAFKIGFYFDFTTGMPVIPGPSIKGAIRSCFPQRSVKTKKPSKYIEQKTEFIKKIIKDELKIQCDIDVDALEDEIFHGVRNGKPIQTYERDIFFDAVPIEIKNTKNQLFDDDYITPHFKNLLQDPKPIKFLKVSPNVVYRFEFKLNNSKCCPEMTSEKKKNLFEYLITTIGIGAKTNVGYGQFEKVALPPSKVTEPLPPAIPDDQIPDKTIPLLKQNAPFPGEVIAQTGEYNRYQFNVGRDVCKVKKRKDKNPNLMVGDKVTIVIKLDYKKGSSLTFQVK